MSQRILSIGWSVNEPLAKEYIFTALILDYDSNNKPNQHFIKIFSLNNPQFKVGEIEEAIGESFDSFDRVIICVSTALGYPQSFVKIVSEGNASEDPFESINQNHYFYRATERILNKHTGHIFTSPVFNESGFNSILVLWQVRRLTQLRAINYLPQNTKSVKNTDKIFTIEVCPDLIKYCDHSTKEKYKKLLNTFCSGLLDEFKTQTFTPELNSVLCSIIGLGYWIQDDNDILQLELSIPEEYSQIVEDEGWIYYPKGLINQERGNDNTNKILTKTKKS